MSHAERPNRLHLNNKMELGLKNKGALVTGNGRGLGRSIAEKLAEENVNIAITDINKDLANKAKDITGQVLNIDEGMIM